jgi:hypothetical protein
LVVNVPQASFEPVPQSARAARNFVRTCLSSAAGLDTDMVVLLATELATNAILHSRLSFVVSVELLPDCVHVGVEDLSAVLPVPGQAADSDVGGRGLAMVATAAHRWGIEPTEVGKRSWFEVRR